jgi:hypothetical protein
VPNNHANDPAREPAPKAAAQAQLPSALTLPQLGLEATKRSVGRRGRTEVAAAGILATVTLTRRSVHLGLLPCVSGDLARHFSCLWR